MIFVDRESVPEPDLLSHPRVRTAFEEALEFYSRDSGERQQERFPVEGHPLEKCEARSGWAVPREMRFLRKSSARRRTCGRRALPTEIQPREAYIQSQVGAGWKLVRTRYDDGGYSGGTLDRPALGQLLADIEGGGDHVGAMADVPYAIPQRTRMRRPAAASAVAIGRRPEARPAGPQRPPTISNWG